MPHFSNLTSCIPIKYYIHFSIAFATAYNEPTTVTFNIPSIKYYIYIFSMVYIIQKLLLLTKYY